ncbi:uncharacterized protein LOC121247544 isoform X2 [Juglans microcarpa x Juglans regia]|uniref:uncharacterized protein LOC121247544 isoform X2 n=1 Tax=Juglans microcarpa x Juglans regia TaxID=2249226 RepID=UPI001B7EB7BF|nr:uncharacterized protein LOC121247544 isoform X2 [Juglans microcarpa x Juglans regia]
MEVEGEDGSRIALQNAPNHKTFFGRGLGFHTDDRTVSRRHVLFEVKTSDDKSRSQTGTTVSFEVVGKNPIWVKKSGCGEIRVHRSGEKGEVAAGDCFCLSGKRPVRFSVRGRGFGAAEKRVLGSEDELDASLTSGFEFGGIDVSEIDPVKAISGMDTFFFCKVCMYVSICIWRPCDTYNLFSTLNCEFGFLVMGHEFDHYPKQMIRDIKNWDWFLEEPGRDSDDDAYLEKKVKRGVMRKRRKADGNDDDNWTGESGDDGELVAKLRKVERPKYPTRSKGAKASRDSAQKKAIGDANDDDETLGGFIVDDDDDDVEQEEESDEDEEEGGEELIEDDNDCDQEIDD